MNTRVRVFRWTKMSPYGLSWWLFSSFPLQKPWQVFLDKMNNNIYKNLFLILIVLFLGVLTISIFLIACDRNIASAEDEILTANDTIPVSLANTYYITYVLDGGTNSPSNPTSVQSTDSAFYLQPATKAGYKFLGWFKDSGYSNYIDKVKPATLSGNLTLYAQFTPYISLPVKYLYTDFYNAIDDTVSYINCYYNFYSYYYENLDSVSTMVSGHSSYTIYTSSNVALDVKQDEIGYFTTSSSGVPSFIRVASDPFFTISYNCFGGALPMSPTPYAYYYKRADLGLNTVTPTKDNAKFMGWYLDEEYTQTPYTSSFTPHDITLYAKWSPIYSINATYKYTDFFEVYEDIVLTIDYYEDEYDYYYSNNFNDLSSYHTDYEYHVYNTNGEIIPYYENDGKIASIKSYGVPSYIKYETPTIYSISYALETDVYLHDGDKLFNYYTKRADLLENDVEPLKDGYMFAGWYLDEECTQTVYSSSFVASDITFFPSWQEMLYLDVYFFDVDKDTPQYIFLGSMPYYIDSLNEYFLGDMQDDTKQLPYYFKQTGSTSYKAYSSDNEEIQVYTNDGMLYAHTDKQISYIRIYLHYNVNFYVNGNLVFVSKGAKGEPIDIPNFISGYIGKNHNAIRVGSLTLGKEYALYIMKGWSKTDSSDITWLDQEEVPLIENDATYDAIAGDNYNLDLYAYMTFYGKVNAINSDIDYDAFIAADNGLVTSASKYTLDELMMEHVTEISSDAQKSNFEKVLKYFKLDSLGKNSFGLLNKILNGDIISFDDIWSSLVGKIIIIAGGIIALAIIVLNIYNFAIAMSKIQANS